MEKDNETGILMQSNCLEDIANWIKNTLQEEFEWLLKLVECHGHAMTMFVENAIKKALFSPDVHLGEDYIPTAPNFLLRNYAFLYKIDEDMDEKTYKVVTWDAVSDFETDGSLGWYDWTDTDEFSDTVERVCDELN